MAKTKLTESEKKARAKEKVREKAEDLATKGVRSAHFNQWLKSALRKGFRKWPAYYLLYATSPSKYIIAPTKRKGVSKSMKHWKCEECGEWFRQCDLAADHKVDVGGPGESAEEAGRMLYRLYTTIDNMQILCAYKLGDTRFSVRSCHTRKTHGDGSQEKSKPVRKKKAPKKKAKK